MSVTLDGLVAQARATMEAERTAEPRSRLERRLHESGAGERLPGRLRAGLRAEKNISVIAELKQASPVAGPLREPFDALDVARAYESNGAAALSVLTEPVHFHGSLERLAAVAGATALPVLRKDFIVDEYQILQAAAAGAAAVLLIAEVLDDATLARLVRFAHELRLDALVELHGAERIDAALASGSGLVGVNNRDLTTMRVDWTWALEVGDRFDDDVVTVAESGIDAPEQLRRLETAGYDAVLVGTALVAQPDPGRALARLRGSDR